jgi:hypothetical protein
VPVRQGKTVLPAVAEARRQWRQEQMLLAERATFRKPDTERYRKAVGSRRPVAQGHTESQATAEEAVATARIQPELVAAERAAAAAALEASRGPAVARASLCSRTNPP